MFRFISQFLGYLLFGSLLFIVGFAVGTLYEAAPSVRDFTPQANMVSLQDPETVTDAFLLACTLEEYDGAAWLADPSWVAAFGSIEQICTAVSAPLITEERFLGLQQQTDQAAFVEWIWFKADDTFVVAYFLLEQSGAIGWQIVGLVMSD
ncbi:MAG: hypothetical protein DHS20C20_26410 [Ardenticatenaceae bacterium]|nr:MAG: hypothetical protein DHS20C20_26410 [Ardenticatenaceae bacterium]